jgi:RNA polymerase sigma factor (sigma-70 family)
MATSQAHDVIQRIRAALPRDGAERTDGQILTEYVNRRDEAALAALVHRHGPMVWGVCRRVLPNHHDAEDAFQATSLVLVRKTASIASRELVANWLYGVAHQTALKARAMAGRRRTRERQVTAMPEREVVTPDVWPDLQPLIDEELSRLPDKYRVPIVLCDLEGKTRKEAARQLGVPEGTVAGRLARARSMLAKRLTRRGVSLSSGALAAALAQDSGSAGVPNAVVSSTINAATLLAAGQAAGVISFKVDALTEAVVKAMFVKKIKTVLVVVLFVAALAGTAGLIYQSHAAAQPQDPKPAAQAPKPADNDAAAKDQRPTPKPLAVEDRVAFIGTEIKAGERVDPSRTYAHLGRKYRRLNEGESVAPGDVVMLLDDSQARARLDAYRVAVESSKLILKKAALIREQTEELQKKREEVFKKGNLSDFEYLQGKIELTRAEATEASQKADVEKAEEEYRAAKLSYDNLTIRWNGTVPKDSDKKREALVVHAVLDSVDMTRPMISAKWVTGSDPNAVFLIFVARGEAVDPRLGFQLSREKLAEGFEHMPKLVNVPLAADVKIMKGKETVQLKDLKPKTVVSLQLATDPLKGLAITEIKVVDVLSVTSEIFGTPKR